jgi:hypothetical protein
MEKESIKEVNIMLKTSPKVNPSKKSTSPFVAGPTGSSKKHNTSLNTIQKGELVLQKEEECPLTTINQQTRRIAEEKKEERKAARAEFEKRQSQHMERKENPVLADHNKKKVVSMSLMSSPVQTLGKVSMICKR